jgi:hypothetical protein
MMYRPTPQATKGLRPRSPLATHRPPLVAYCPEERLPGRTSHGFERKSAYADRAVRGLEAALDHVIDSGLPPTASGFDGATGEVDRSNHRDYWPPILKTFLKLRDLGVEGAEGIADRISRVDITDVDSRGRVCILHPRIQPLPRARARTRESHRGSCLPRLLGGPALAAERSVQSAAAGMDVLGQPLPADRMHLMQELRKSVRIPFAVDQSSVSPADFFAHAAEGTRGLPPHQDDSQRGRVADAGPDLGGRVAAARAGLPRRALRRCVVPRADRGLRWRHTYPLGEGVVRSWRVTSASL